MNEKPKYDKESFIRLVSSFSENDESEKNMKEFLQDEGLNPDQIIKMWDDHIEQKIRESQIKKRQQRRGPKPG